ncbi:MAG: hypothetical protein WB781_11950 [Candidatus Sulfotelmatobacter sp.]
MAMEQPRTDIIWHHIGDSHHHWFQVHHVGSHSVEHNGLTMPVRCMDIIFITVGKQALANSLSFFHGHHGQIPLNEPVQRIEEKTQAEGRIC